MKLLHIFFLITIAFFISCEKEIPLDIDDVEPVLVVNCAFKTNNFWEVTVEKSEPLTQPGTNRYIDFAKVSIYDNATNKLIEELKKDEDNKYRSQTNKPEAGKEYKIIVEKEGFKTVQAIAKCPTTFNTKFVSFEKIKTDFPYRYKVKLKREDNKNEENYYLIHLYVKSFHPNGDLHTYSSKYIFSNDVNIDNKENYFDTEETEYNYIILKDSFFENKSYTINLEFEENSGGSSYKPNYYVEVQNLSYEMYMYYKTSKLYIDNKDGVFSQPVQIYNNINNGLGIFGGINVQTLKKEIK